MRPQLHAVVAETARAPRPAGNLNELLDRQPLFVAMFDYAPLPQAIAAPDGAILRVNPAFTAMLGYTAEDLRGKGWLDITHPDDVPRSLESRRRIELNVPRLSFQKRYIHKNGRCVSALVTLCAIELDGCRGIMGQIVDLTAIKQANSEAQDAHERLQTAMEGAGAGTWTVDLVTGHMEWDDAMRRQFGLGEEDAVPNLEAFVASIHHDDRRSVLAAIHNATLPGHGRVDHEYRIHCHDGVERWYRSLGRAQRDAAGRAVRGTGIAFDITQSKQAQLDRERMQASLHRAESRLAAIVANSRDAIIGLSSELRVTTWNAAAQAMFGYTEVEAIGMSAIHLLAPERRDRIGQGIGILRAGQTLPVIETAGLRQDGARFHAELMVSPVPGDDGASLWFSAIVRDITERKAIERQLRESVDVMDPRGCAPDPRPGA